MWHSLFNNRNGVLKINLLKYINNIKYDIQASNLIKRTPRNSGVARGSHRLQNFFFFPQHINAI